MLSAMTVCPGIASLVWCVCVCGVYFARVGVCVDLFAARNIFLKCTVNAQLDVVCVCVVCEVCVRCVCQHAVLVYEMQTTRVCVCIWCTVHGVYFLCMYVCVCVCVCLCMCGCVCVCECGVWSVFCKGGCGVCVYRFTCSS
jgi:hypothetical protein